VFEFCEGEPEDFGGSGSKGGDLLHVFSGARGRPFYNDWTGLPSGNFCPPVFWARVVFRQSVFNAEVSLAEGTLKG